MELKELLLNRRTIHDYKPSQIDLDVVKQALNAAIYAPNHKKTWPWYFVIGGERVKQKLAQLSIQLKQQKQPLSEVKKQALASKFNNASYLIALGQKRSDDPQQSKEDYATVSCGVQNISLFLWDKGIGTKWSSGAVTKHKETYKIFGIDESKYELVGFLWVGQPLRIPTAPERPPLESFMKIID